MSLKIMLLFSIKIIVPTSSIPTNSYDSTSEPITATSTSNIGTITSNDETDNFNNNDETISPSTINNIIGPMVKTGSIMATSSHTSSSPPKTLIQYPYQPEDQYEIEKLAGKISSNYILATLPSNLTFSYFERPQLPNVRLPIIEKMTINSLTPKEQAQAKLADLTNTELQCYVAPPTNISLEDMMGFWYVVRKVNDSEGTDYKYICEEIVYTLTGPTTFNKVSDVHFHGRWMTIHGNGTFVPPGIVIIDWVVLDDPSKADRLVFTVLGADYSHWAVGYDCITGNMRPEVVLQTRHKKVRAKYLNQAYQLIHSDDLPLDDMVCETGFKSTVISKSNSNTSAGSRASSVATHASRSYKSGNTHSSLTSDRMSVTGSDNSDTSQVPEETYASSQPDG